MPSVKMWAILNRGRLSQGAIYHFRSDARDYAKYSKEQNRSKFFPKDYKVVPIIVSWDDKRKPR